MSARRDEAITVANRVMVDETHSVFPWTRVATAVVDAVIPVLTDEDGHKISYSEYPTGRIKFIIADGTHWVSVASANLREDLGRRKEREYIEEEELSEEYVLVYDGDPYMDGTHERRETGRFTSLESAQRGFVVVSERSVRAPKANLRIERRLVGPWEVVE